MIRGNTYYTYTHVCCKTHILTGEEISTQHQSAFSGLNARLFWLVLPQCLSRSFLAFCVFINGVLFLLLCRVSIIIPFVTLCHLVKAAREKYASSCFGSAMAHMHTLCKSNLLFHEYSSLVAKGGLQGTSLNVDSQKCFLLPGVKYITWVI